MRHTTGLFLSACLAMSGAVAADKAPGPLEAVKAGIESGSLPGVHGVIVEHRGERLAEWYFPGHDQTILEDLGHVEFTADTLHGVRSVTKSVVSLLFGIALEEGIVKDIDAPVTAWFPEYAHCRVAGTAPESLRFLRR